MTRQPKSSGGARRTRCRCGRPVYRQIVGALDVTADADGLTLAEARQRTTPNRLAWCLYQRGEWSPQNLRSAHPSSHPADCPHPHVVDHVCTGPPPAAPPAGRRTRKTSPSVHPGQQQLAL
ncbi:hypothetical protein [Streptomyces sp. NBC_00038]|uniref:hypothetical protein n=1 Tax=Streptomyces sp. NBC_00038 TaxID=2903615 RepID=UPI0022531301|nr:hypothetical protein [Streptomyces sp. NBC_00038]MCX5562753.1 hypothetical protein [Streptomyces sp. NBC_00038]MCX5563597.1 hypothetical protein [Streptomyces sp. NBC_00038]